MRKFDRLELNTEYLLAKHLALSALVLLKFGLIHLPRGFHFHKTACHLVAKVPLVILSMES